MALVSGWPGGSCTPGIQGITYLIKGRKGQLFFGTADSTALSLKVSWEVLCPCSFGDHLEGVSAPCKSSGLWKEIQARTQPWLGDLALRGWEAQGPEGDLGSASGKLWAALTPHYREQSL